MRLIAIAAMATCSLSAQDLRITADLLSTKTTHTMFGRLPKEYSAASVGICNDTQAAQTVPLSRIAQQVRIASGPTLLPKDAALAVIAAAQGGSPAAIALRIGMAAVGFAALGASWSGATESLKNVLTSSAIVGGGAIGILGTTIPTHTYLTFDHEAIQDPVQLSAMGCVSGIVIVEKAAGSGRVDVSISLPKGATQ